MWQTAHVAFIAVVLVLLDAGGASSEAPARGAVESPATLDVAALHEYCAGGNPSVHGWSCYALANHYLEGTGVPRDPKRALALLQKACDARHGLACASLGSRYASGTGVPKDAKRAEFLWDRACRHGEQLGCLLLGSVRRARDRAQGKPSKEVCARHILVKVESPSSAGHPEAEARRRAEAALVSLEAGTDFASLARKVSEDSGSAAGGGDLGCFARGVMLPELEDAAFSLKVGQTSVIRTDLGFHVVQRTVPPAPRN